MSPVLVDKLSAATTKPTTEMQPLVEEALRANAFEEFPAEQHDHETMPPNDPIPSIANVAARQYPVSPRAATESVPLHAPRSRRSRAPWIIAGALAAIVLLGGGGFAIYKLAIEDSGGGGSGSSDPVALADAGARQVDGGERAMVDAGVIDDATMIAEVPVDAAVKPPPSDSLSIVSTPPGARVFINGSDAGVTPLKLPGSTDRHTIALLLPGHELYVAQVDGTGSFSIPLKEVTPSGGPAGIKVINCKAKDRYYVFVDGKPTGQTCPTERIETVMGPHTVEVYDVVSETRRKWDINVTETRLSYRVRIDN
jgi:hypothetical protein